MRLRERRTILQGASVRRTALRAPRSSSHLASQTVQVASEATARPIITSFTMMSAWRNMPHGERSCGSSAVLIEVSPGSGGAGALALGARAFAGLEVSGRGYPARCGRLRGGRHRRRCRRSVRRCGHRESRRRRIGGCCGRTGNRRRGIGERGGLRCRGRLRRRGGPERSRGTRAPRGGSIGLGGGRTGECNQRQERRKHRERAETELQSPLRPGSHDAATAMAAPEFRFHVLPTQSTPGRDAMDRELVQQMALCNRFSGREQLVQTLRRQ